MFALFAADSEVRFGIQLKGTTIKTAYSKRTVVSVIKLTLEPQAITVAPTSREELTLSPTCKLVQGGFSERKMWPYRQLNEVSPTEQAHLLLDDSRENELWL